MWERCRSLTCETVTFRLLPPPHEHAASFAAAKYPGAGGDAADSFLKNRLTKVGNKLTVLISIGRLSLCPNERRV